MPRSDGGGDVMADFKTLLVFCEELFNSGTERGLESQAEDTPSVIVVVLMSNMKKRFSSSVRGAPCCWFCPCNLLTM